MAVTITRTPWIDDDGTGTTGTVINNAVKTSLYNEIDGALAKLPQLTGGNAFTGNQTLTGNQTITGTLTVSGIGPNTFTSNFAGVLVALSFQNTNTGATAATRFMLGNDADPALMIFQVYGSGFTSGGYQQANGGLLYCGGAGGMSVLNTAIAPIRFYTNASERMRLLGTGELLIGSTTPLFTPRVGIAADLSGANAIVIQNLNPGNTGNFALFVNAAGAVAGNISQNGVTAVIYGTTSDARLKVDRGRATNLAALRAVRVHDFTWIADGGPDRGVFAQEARAVYPRAVLEGSDERTAGGALARPWMTDYSKFVADLIVGWQRHDDELADVRAQLATLKGSQ